MTIVVTGGAGFIGTNYLFHMLEKHPEDRYICFDKLTYAGNAQNLSPLMPNPQFSFIKGDICNRDDVEKLFEKERPDLIVNFAAESHVDRSIEDPGIFIRTNVTGVQVLSDACLKYGIRRFHQVSTDEVYGDLPVDRPELSFDETASLRPSSPYSASKAAADLLLLAYYRTYGLPVTISRCGNNYGPYQHPEKLIPKAILHALNNKPVPVYGDGKNVREWIHVKDHCHAIDTVIRNGKDGEIYNVGSGYELNNLELVKHILHELNKPEELIEYVPDRKGHDRRYALNSEKIQAELGWRCETEFVEGIRNTIRSYISGGINSF